MASSMEPGLAGDGTSTLPVIAATPARLMFPLNTTTYIIKRRKAHDRWEEDRFKQ